MELQFSQKMPMSIVHLGIRNLLWNKVGKLSQKVGLVTLESKKTAYFFEDLLELLVPGTHQESQEPHELMEPQEPMEPKDPPKPQFPRNHKTPQQFPIFCARAIITRGL